MGVSTGPGALNSRNIASVMVTSELPAFIKKGQRINVTVSALGDSTSLSGGTLLMTPLYGPDMRTYAVAQGLVVVNGQVARSATSQYYKNQTTVASSFSMLSSIYYSRFRCSNPNMSCLASILEIS